MSNIRVLVVDGSGKQSPPMLRGLKEAGCHVTVLCETKLDTCYCSNVPDVKLLKPGFNIQNPGYIDYLVSLLETGNYDVIMPIGEKSTDMLTRHEAQLCKYAKMACAPREVYIKAYNKQITFDIAMDAGIPCPYTRKSTQPIEDFLANAKFPVIIKPRQGFGSIGFHKFETEAEFREYLADPNFNVDDYVVQEFVKFDKRVGTLLFIDQKGNVCMSYAVDVLRQFPLDAGSAVLIQTVQAQEALGHAAKLLKTMGWKGFADVAFMIDKETGKPVLLEINGRIPASIRMSYLLGYNVAKQFMEMIYDQEVTRYPDNESFGRCLRHFDMDIMWLLKSPTRFKAEPSWFSWKNTTEILYWKDDKKPFFANFLQKTCNLGAILKSKKH